MTTDGLASYNACSLGARPHDKVVQTKEQEQENDAIQNCHWAISYLKRWLMGTHHGAVSAKHLQACLDEFAFRYNRRKTNGVGRIAARVLENLATANPMSMRQLIDGTKPCRLFLLDGALATLRRGIGMVRLRLPALGPPRATWAGTERSCPGSSAAAR